MAAPPESDHSSAGAPLPDRGARPSYVTDARAVGPALDTLVRTVRSRGAGQVALADRALSVWRRADSTRLELRADGLYLGTSRVLEGSGTERQWLLPAFLAGVRVLSLEPGTTSEQLLAVAVELGALGVNAEEVTRFQDWLWGDGAEGMQVDCQPSFVEVMDAVAAAESAMGRPASPFGAVRGEAARAEDGVALDVRELDAAALRIEFDVPLEVFTRTHGERPSSLPADELDALRGACDGAAAWAELETDAVLSYPALQLAVPPARLARSLRGRLAGGALAELLPMLVELHAATDAYRKAVTAALAADGLGPLLGERAEPRDGQLSPLLPDLLARLPPADARSCVHRLLDRAGAEPDLLRALAAWMHSGGLASWQERIDHPSLSAREAVGLVQLYTATGVPCAMVADVLDGAPLASAGTALEAIDAGCAPSLRPQLQKLLHTASPARLTALLSRLVAGSSTESAEVAADLLLLSRAQGMKGRDLYSLALELVRRDVGIEALVSLAREREAAPTVRLGSQADGGVVTMTAIAGVIDIVIVENCVRVAMEFTWPCSCSNATACSPARRCWPRACLAASPRCTEC